MPAKLQPNRVYESAPFYAVILNTYEMEDCDGGEVILAIEADWREVQAAHRDRKVFAAYECPNMGAVGYDFEGRWDETKDNLLIGNFLAIYAGETKKEAEQLLQKVKERYPKAQIKQMRANYEWIMLRATTPWSDNKPLCWRMIVARHIVARHQCT